ncbi:MAG: right-handed parallel beta-helix repeat-containing protein, partial [Planctomycetes bacterium]|nr:right-handed parallel beta-helix repeat-containing protein [Planctomycetota bacterium]
FRRPRVGLVAYTNDSVVEDCLITSPGGTIGLDMRGKNNIIRRCTVLDALNQAIFWMGESFVIEDNFVLGGCERPGIYWGNFYGLVKSNGTTYSTVRNNVIAESDPNSTAGLWLDTGGVQNAIYGNTILDQQSGYGIYLELGANGNLCMYNTITGSHVGIGIRNNMLNNIAENYIYDVGFIGICFMHEAKYGAMHGALCEGNWLDSGAVDVSTDTPTGVGDGHPVLFDRNHYRAAGTLMNWGGTNYTTIGDIQTNTDQEYQATQAAIDPNDVKYVTFRMPYSTANTGLFPMMANPDLKRVAPSGAGGYYVRPYFFRQGHGDHLSFGAGDEGPWSATGGIIHSSYPCLPSLWAVHGSQVYGQVDMDLDPNNGDPTGDPNEWGISVKGVQAAKMNGLGDGWWTPTMPTKAGTQYAIAFDAMMNTVVHGSSNRAGPVVFALWTDDTGQNIKRDYVWGYNDLGIWKGTLDESGSFAFSSQSATTVTAPTGAKRVAFFFGLVDATGTLRFREIALTGS